MTEEFKSENLTVTVNRQPDCVVEMELAAKPEMAEKTYKKALKNISREVSFPGFRKGKAPDSMVESKYGPQIDREFKELFLNDSVKQALDLTKLFPWNQSEKIKADINEASREKGGLFKIKFETFPEIPEIKPADLEVKGVESKELKDEDIDRHILSLRYHHSDWKEVEDRPIRENDRVEVTVAIADDENDEKSKNRFHIHKDFTEDWLYDLLLDKKLGESFEATPPEKEEGTPKKVNITVDKIMEADLVPLDEEFVKKFGAENPEDFKKKVSDHLKHQVEERATQQFHAMIQQELTEKYHFDVPSSLINQERQNLLTEMIENLKESNYSDEAIQQQKDSMEELALRNAIKNLRTHYILLKIADEQKFNISREEMMNELIKHSIQPDGTINMEMVQQSDKYSAPIVRRLQLMKAMEYLADKVTRK